jgi:arylsulfatase A-like enzyme
LPWIAAVALFALIGIQSGLWLWERMATKNLPRVALGLPNVLVIVVDTLRADHLSSYGYKRLTSPNIDRLAREGILFETALATSSFTLPSHASLLTGLYTYEHEAEWMNPKALFSCQCPTLAEALRSLGYRTGAFSANLFWFTHEYGFGRGFIRFDDFFHSINDMMLRTFYGRVIEQFVLRRLGFEDIPARKRASDINRAALSWIESDQTRPFFVLLNYMDTHDPYLPPQPYRNTFSSLKNPGGVLNWRLGRNDPQMTPEELQGEVDAYDGGIVYVDHHIGQFLAELQKSGPAGNTLVVLTSDHGEALGEHGLYLHGNSLFREAIHVPLIFWWPGQIPAGVSVARPVTNAALPATIMDLLGADNQMLFPSAPLTKLWENPKTHSAWPYPLTEIGQMTWLPEISPVYHGSIKSLVSPQWHYIEHETLGTELYDWQNDPQELHNLVVSPETSSEGARLSLQLRQIFSNDSTIMKKFP